MHMADALISPAVGGTLWAVSAGAVAHASTRLQQEADTRKAPLMGVMGAFLFAAQMINFTIPATGSSGHVGGGLLLAVLLGPQAALLVITSVLMVQALFFADGGLLALGCNIFNMGVIPAYLVYPLVYRPLAGSHPTAGRRNVAIMLAALTTLQLGPLGVVLETVASGISALPFRTFLWLMQPIHLLIGLVEGLVTVAVVTTVRQARPDILAQGSPLALLPSQALRRLVIGFLVAAVLTGGGLSLYASSNPDGLEWAVQKITGATEVAGQDTALHRLLAALQTKVAFLPDYSFKRSAADTARSASAEPSHLGTSLSGLVGGTLTLLLLLGAGLLLQRTKRAGQAE